MPTKLVPKWLENVRSAWRLPKKLTVSEWADTNRYLDPMTSAEPGRWRTDRTPYLKEIMDSFRDPGVQDITIMSSTQVGKTESLMNMIGYVIDQDPAPALFVLPGETQAKDMSKDRVQPMIRLSPALNDHTTPKPDDMARTKITLDRMILYFAWSNSPASLASKPIRYLFLDEIDKYPKFSGREADPLKLATERTSTFWNRKIVKCSTPTTREGYIFREYELSDKRNFNIPCPHCGKYQVLHWPQVKWPEGERDSEKIKENRLAWYECAGCKGKISDEQKMQAIRKGVWAPEGCTVDKNGRIRGKIPRMARRGYWLNALYSPWRTFSEVAAEFLQSQESIESLMNFVNSWLAEVWEEKAEETTDDMIIKLAVDYPAGLVPDKALILTAGVDVQKDHFYYVIRGWGIGEESWLIRAVRVESWEEIRVHLLSTLYQKPNGEALPVRLTCLDSAYRTDEVYDFCRRWKDVTRPTKGKDTLGGVPYRLSRLDRNIGGEILKSSISLWLIDTCFFKDKITRMIQSAPEDPAQFHLYQNPSEDYIKQMTSEHKVIIRDRKTGRAQEVWKKKRSGLANHYWDVEVLACAAAHMCHISALKPDSGMNIHRPDHSRKSGWIGNRKGWMR